MTPEDEQRVMEMQRQLNNLRDRIAAFERMQVATESGSGQVIVSGDNVLLRIDSLTDNSAIIPG